VQVRRHLQTLLQAGHSVAEGGLLLRRLLLDPPGRGLRGVPVEGPGRAGGGQAEAGAWTSSDGQGLSKVSIVAELVEYMLQLKQQDGDGNDGEEKIDEPVADEQLQEQAELNLA
jgi:hypothetical protein